jgi:bifunctional DNA-binding transcriptional regulator/antitoxin component of YhaV-PrlF toxin-antitoxin module
MASSMRTLTIRSRGRMTLPKDLLLHLGVGRGDEIEFELLPDAPAALMRGKPSKITANDPGLNTVME